MDKEANITPEIPNSAPQKERGRFHDPIKYVKLTLAGALGLAIGIACNPAQSRNINITESPIVPTATATFEPSPTVTSTPEVKKIEPFDCGILSPEACATGEYIQWNRPDGQPLRGMGFKLKAKEGIKIPESLVVAALKFKEGTNYRGNLIKGISQDGKRVFNYYGDVIPDPEKNIGNTGKSFPAETVIATIEGTGLTVFPESEYNLIVQFPTVNDLKNNHPEQTIGTPKIINNQPITTPGGSTEEIAILWDVPVNRP